tara:strand:- start:520 stop:684 length:165 start_codon:yes stop_codon:yes gene_type:complete
MPRIGDNLSLEPSLEEEEYIHETNDDFEEDCELKHKDREEERQRILLFKLLEKF